ncbi:hypothetical protein CHLNCDRAFT_142243 [Chlorella variabilis]|uniref:HPP transmembrane region domain-containing protein n=1 Tax=Chlorella variabilis TaxID=554065 RepID=E1Z840_CHLVA|nr:hypothetical protein CHLNCDRAFT_142243 [Chlorella variabilis]EFN58032.1 hypothetical protein CHLNCDRAFT_142243 [Chlorella variabilis]|eukprot:XP_005850134.1 hypothetical protein CHLNCDRAFT_142243 [Chlorella variabilis]
MTAAQEGRSQQRAEYLPHRPPHSGGRQVPDSPARASTPAPMDDYAADNSSNRGHSLPRQRSFSIHADGSAHGGRRYVGAGCSREGSTHGGLRFVCTGSREGSAHGGRRHVGAGSREGSTHGGWRFFESASRDEQWAQARAEEYALEQHSLQDDAHPARLPGGSGRGATAGQAALRLAGEGPAGHHAVWVTEDGSAKGGVQPPALPSSTGGGGFSGISGGGGGGGKGGLDTRLPIPPLRDVFWSWLGAFLGILAISAMNQWVTPEIDIVFVVGSFGASAVLVFALLESKMSQPRNFLGGQMLSALVGITTRVVIHQVWIAGPVGMSLALVAMQLTATTHPPGGATALIACTLPTLPKWHGYSYLVTIGVSSIIMQLIALVVNNIDPRRRYPTYYW